MTAHFSTYSFVAGVIVGALLAGAWFFVDESPTSTSLLSDTSRDEGLMLESDLMSVANQSAGLAVVVASVSVPPPGVWVAVRETVGSELGNVLGAARVGGPRTAVSVPLLRATLPGRTYAAELYRDDNGGAFDPAKNSAYIDFDTGSRVVVHFTTLR